MIIRDRLSNPFLIHHSLEVPGRFIQYFNGHSLNASINLIAKMVCLNINSKNPIVKLKNQIKIKKSSLFGCRLRRFWKGRLDLGKGRVSAAGS